MRGHNTDGLLTVSLSKPVCRQSLFNRACCIVVRKNSRLLTSFTSGTLSDRPIPASALIRKSRMVAFPVRIPGSSHPFAPASAPRSGPRRKRRSRYPPGCEGTRRRPGLGFHTGRDRNSHRIENTPVYGRHISDLPSRSYRPRCFGTVRSIAVYWCWLRTSPDGTLPRRRGSSPDVLVWIAS